MLWSAALCVAALSLAGGVPLPSARDPYIEDIAFRYTFQGVDPVAGWGVLPNIDAATGAQHACVSDSCGFFLLGGLTTPFLTFSHAPHQVSTAAVAVSYPAPKTPTPSAGVIVSPHTSTPLAVVHGGGVVLVASGAAAEFEFGGVAGVAIVSYASPAEWHAVVAGGSGLVSVVASPAAPLSVTLSVPVGPTLAVTSRFTGAATTADQVSVATGAKLFFLSSALDVVRWEWSTQHPEASGGPIDDTITSLAYDSCGALWVTNAVAVNIVALNGTVSRIVGLSGLPYNDTNAVVGTSTGAVWIGSTEGVMRFAPSYPTTAADACYEAVAPTVRGQFRYYYGRRYLPDNSVVGLAWGSGQTLAVAATGVSLFVHQQWTLADKAAWYLDIIPRHDRDGFVADCGLGTPGNLSAITCSAGESDGLWTGIVLAGESFLEAVNATAGGLSRVTRRTQAMLDLYNVTAIDGYPARTLQRIGAGPVGANWHNSTSMPGYQWQGDTSADELCGHFIGLPASFWLAPGTGLGARVSARVTSFVSGVVKHGYRLLGFDGVPTKWGNWAPSFINGMRSWSDQRGLNSLQMLAFLRAAVNMTGDADGSMQAALEFLTDGVNQYDLNMVNLKIEVAVDDNYSDDELAFLPFYAFFKFSNSTAFVGPAVLGITRLAQAVRHEKCAAWNAMYMAATNTVDAGLLADMVWSLRTWPLELIDWDVKNSQRLDIELNPEQDRRNEFNTQSARILPANERAQYRLNANPFTLDGGTGGGREFDPGAWLLGYSVARLNNLLTA